MADVEIEISVDSDADFDVADDLDGAHWVVRKFAHPCMLCKLNENPEKVYPLGPGVHHGCRCRAVLQSGSGPLINVLR